jgi:hypothetical protein
MAASKLPSCISALGGCATAAAVVLSGCEVSGLVICLTVLEAELFVVSGMIASPVLARRTI